MTLPRALRVLALVPIGTGLLSVVTGSATLVATGDVAPSVESELRFYAVWWAAAGLWLWSLAPRVHERPAELRAFCALLLAGGGARLLAWAAEGRPPAGTLALLGVELVLPLVLLVWHARGLPPASPGPRVRSR